MEVRIAPLRSRLCTGYGIVFNIHRAPRNVRALGA